MSRRILPAVILFFFCLVGLSRTYAQSTGYPITPVLFTDVKVSDDFWSKRLETNRTVSIPHALKKCDETGRIRNFDIADSVLKGEIAKGKFCSRYGFDDSDVFKVIEGIAYSLQTHYDADLDWRADTLIAKIARAQELDGYLYTMRTIDAEKSWAKERWVNDRTHSSHELYNLGHLYEAAVAHYYATKKRALLDIALRSADLLVKTFGPDKMHTVPGHQVTEIGLVKLYLVTGKKEYLELADFFVNERGRGNPPGETYNQDKTPILDETEAVGHAVRAGYFYAGVADVAALTDNTRYLNVLDRIWEDVVTKKLYITGGVGAVGNIEGYGAPYELPNLSAYCETCAGIALAYWNHRMFLLHGDAKYMDVIERVIYNGFLSGVSMTGDMFFYPNPLESIKGADRSPWFTCACCPSNDVRFVPSIPGYMYGLKGNTIYVNLFIGGSATLHVGNDIVTVKQSTKYPWEGKVAMTVGLQAPRDLTINIRIPGWAGSTPVAGDLYSYQRAKNDNVKLSVNGEPQSFAVVKGYAQITRNWHDGDTIVFELPMNVRRVVANAKVEADRGKIALERGPIVFCLEGADQPDGRVLDLLIPDSAGLGTQYRADLLGGVQVITGKGFGTKKNKSGTAVLDERREFTAIPYYAWAHRGRHAMNVWPARDLRAVRPKLTPSIASQSTVTASTTNDASPVNDQYLAKSSNDESTPRLHWWPKKGGTEWVQYTFAAPTRIGRTSVYWFDDTGAGECRVPKSWRILYRSGQEWKPVSGAGVAGCKKDRMNVVRFNPVTTDAIRLEVTMQEGFSGGIYEWEVNP
jgi:uncharacterized protein